jgi:hypothetical protein
MPYRLKRGNENFVKLMGGASVLKKPPGNTSHSGIFFLVFTCNGMKSTSSAGFFLLQTVANKHGFFPIFYYYGTISLFGKFSVSMVISRPSP